MMDTVIEAALMAVEASQPCGIFIGVVKKTSPLTIRISQKLELDKDFLIVLDHVPDLAVGDVVTLLRVQGGQAYVVIGRVKP